MHYRSLDLCLSVCSCATRIHVTRTPARECFSQEVLRQRGVYVAAAPDLQQPLETPQAAPARSSPLIGLDRLKFHILKCAKFKQGTVCSTAEFREWLQKYKKEYKDLAKQVQEAANSLAKCGLLAKAEGGDENNKKKAGRKVDQFRKAKWSEVVASQTALDEVRRLKLSRKHFDN